MKNRELVEQFAAAYDRFNIENCCKFIHPEIVVRSLTSDRFDVRGKENFKQFYANAFAKYPQQKTKLLNRLESEDLIIDEELLLGRPEKPEGYHGFVMYAFRDGLIDRIWI